MARGLHRFVPVMRAAILSAVAFALLCGGVALAWDLVVVTDEERVLEVVSSVVDASEDARAEAAMRAVSLESHALEVSAPGVDHVYDAADRSPLLDLAAQVEEALAGAEVSVLQSEVTVRGDDAHATLNLELRHGDETSFVPMNLDLVRLGDGFVVTRIRLQR